MDFGDLMSLAASNEKVSKKQFNTSSHISTDLGAPKKERKSTESSSDTLKKLRDEKIREKEARERKIREREKQKERERKEAEKKKIFRIPKAGSSDSKKTEDKHVQSKSSSEKTKEKSSSSSDKRSGDKQREKSDSKKTLKPSSGGEKPREKTTSSKSANGSTTKVPQTPSTSVISAGGKEYDYTKDVEQMQYTFKGPRTAQPALSSAWLKMEAQIRQEKQDAMRKRAAEINRKIQEDLIKKEGKSQEEKERHRDERDQLLYEQRQRDKAERRARKMAMKEAAFNEYHAKVAAAKKELKSSNGVAIKEFTPSKDKDRPYKHERPPDKPKPPEVTQIKPKPKPPVIKKRPRPNTVGAPLDFSAILKMAETKQTGGTVDKKAAPIVKKKKEDRPMTQDEKDRIARKQTKEYQDWIKHGKERPPQPEVSSDSDSFSDISDDEPIERPPTSSSKSSMSKSFSSYSSHKPSPTSSVNSKLSSSFSGSKSHSSSKVSSSSYKEQQRPGLESKGVKLSNHSSKIYPDKHKHLQSKERERLVENRDSYRQSSSLPQKHKDRHRESPQNHRNSLQAHHDHERSYSSKDRQKLQMAAKQSVKSRDDSPHRPNNKYTEKNNQKMSRDRYDDRYNSKHNSSSQGSKDKYREQKVPNDKYRDGPKDKVREQQKMMSKERRREDERYQKTEYRGGKKARRDYEDEHENVLVCGPASPSPPSSPVATNPFDRIVGEIRKNNPKKNIQAKKRRVIDSESEEDADMADFIDDDEDEDLDDPSSLDYSKYIRQIFGYDKRKFRGMREDDVDCMESNYATVMKEEARSAKMGLLEDLEDMRMEQEELEQKRKMKMKGKRR